MANTVVKLRAIAWTAFEETTRRKVFYLVAFLLALLLVALGSQTLILNMAHDAGETAVVTQFHSDFIEQIFSTWNVAAAFLALYLGAVSVSSEVAGRTIVNVISRPVDRSTYLVGRWLGTLAFLWSFELVGILIALGAVRFWSTPHTSMLWLGCVQLLVSALLYSGASLGLSVVMPPIVAGGIALLLPAIPSMVGDTVHDPRWIWRSLANAAYYVAPAQMPVDLIGESLSKERLHPAYALYTQVLGENVLYAVAIFVLACAIFGRRELRLR